MESGLAAAQGFVEFGAGAGEVFFLRRGDGADFAAAAGVDGVELGGDDGGCDWWDGCGSSFVASRRETRVVWRVLAWV